MNLLVDYILAKEFLLQCFATLITFSFIRLYLFFSVRKKRYQLFGQYGIPQPKTSLLGGGNFHLYSANQEEHQKVDEQLYARHGPVFGLFMGDDPEIVIVDLELLREIFFDQAKSFPDRTRNFLDITLTKSVLFAPFNRWRIMRKVMSPWFSGHQLRRGFKSIEFIEHSVAQMLDYIEHKFHLAKGLLTKEAHVTIELDIHDLFKATALHMISVMAIELPNVQIREMEQNVISLDKFLANANKGLLLELTVRYSIFKSVLNFIVQHFDHSKQMSLIESGLNRKIDSQLAKLKELSQKSNINQGKLGGSEEKLIDALIELHFRGKLTREEVLANAEAILFAGYDTTSTTLTYIFWVLGKEAAVQERLRQDLVTYGVKSVYLGQVISETMRLYPTVFSFTTRVASETVQLKRRISSRNLIIPKGTKVVYKSWLIHRNPLFWPNPSHFDPERFAPNKEIHPCAFAPFGLNEKRCLGYQLAMIEMKMIICDTLLRYKVETVSPEELEIVSYAGFLTKPKEKVIVRLAKLPGIE